MKPLIASVSPSGHRISTSQPEPGFFRATKAGRCSNILRICAYGGPVQASYPASIKLPSPPPRCWSSGCCRAWAKPALSLAWPACAQTNARSPGAKRLAIFHPVRPLEALREELRKRDYLPILFDFEKPWSRDTDETIMLLARMARFVIADISDAKAVLQELRAIVPDLPSVPVQPIILAIQEEPGMFDFYRNGPSFLTVAGSDACSVRSTPEPIPM
jgi:hypothetical protein